MRKRVHPMHIFQSIVDFIRQNIFLIIILFVLNWGRDDAIFTYGRWAFIGFIILSIIYMIIAWMMTTYEFKDETAHLYTGVFKKSHRSIPLYRIQNVRRNVPFYFKLFQITSLTLETGMSQESGSLHFKALSNKEADRIEQLLSEVKLSTREEEVEEYDENTSAKLTEHIFEEINPKQIIHFNPTKKEVFKASFLSFSFLAIIPLAITGYFKIEDVIDIEDQLTGIYSLITSSWISIVITVILSLIAICIFGIVYTYLRYGKYEIASDETNIYITSGVLNEKSFSVRKERVQAIQINQPFLKKLLGLAEVKLISASSNLGESSEVSSLYPFLPVKRAYSVLEEILPQFTVLDEMNKLPTRALKVKIMRIPIFSLIVLGGLLWFIPRFWWIALIILAITYLTRFFEYRNTRYTMEGPFIQFKVGGLSSTVFITTRKLVTQIEVEQSILQRKYDLTSIKTYNRTGFYHVEFLEDIPKEVGTEFIHWYAKRLNEIEYES